MMERNEDSEKKFLSKMHSRTSINIEISFQSKQLITSIRQIELAFRVELPQYNWMIEIYLQSLFDCMEFISPRICPHFKCPKHERVF
jgi:hypothetical protein